MHRATLTSIVLHQRISHHISTHHVSHCANAYLATLKRITPRSTLRIAPRQRILATLTRCVSRHTRCPPHQRRPLYGAAQRGTAPMAVCVRHLRHLWYACLIARIATNKPKQAVTVQNLDKAAPHGAKPEVPEKTEEPKSRRSLMLMLKLPLPPQLQLP